MKNKIKQLLRENLLLEVNNKEKIIKFGGSPQLADWAQNLSNKYSTWIANTALKYDERANNSEFIRDFISNNGMQNIVSLLKTPYRPKLNLSTLNFEDARELTSKFEKINKWIDESKTNPNKLLNMSWDEAEQKADEWLKSPTSIKQANELGDDSEIIHQFNDGFMWVLTKSDTCTKMQQSMGHCGHTENKDMYLIRLIKDNEDYITVDWHPQEKYTTEIKGRGNSKPKPKYYPYILWLLTESDMIKELRYDDAFSKEKNFKISDLNSNDIDKVVLKRPDLFDKISESIIKNLIKQSLLEADNRQKIIKFTGNPQLAEWSHNISDKFSVWIADNVKKLNLPYNAPRLENVMTNIIKLFKTENRPRIDFKNTDYHSALEKLNDFRYIMDWVDNPNTPPVDLRNMSWTEAMNKATEWHDILKSGGEVENIIDDDTELLHKFPDGYAWYLTRKNYCEASKDSMGHCAQASDDDMYLLRLIKGKEEFITADWHPDDEYIMQLKGKQNNKPIPKYHPYIMWLLNHNAVKELRTHEGYKPETNFQISDLSPENIINIVKTKPDLLTSTDIYNLLKNPDTSDFVKQNFSEEKLIDTFSDLYQSGSKQATISFIKLIGPEILNKFSKHYIARIVNSFRNYSNYDELIHLIGDNNIKKMSDESIEHIGDNSNYGDKIKQLLYSIKNSKPQPVHETYKNLIKETLLNKTDSSINQISDFVNFTKKYLNINDDIKVALAFERTPDLSTTAYYNLDGFVKVYVKDRAIIDICRSIAHELTHHKQNLEGRLLDAVKDGADGSDIENEANAKAGEIIRKYGKLNPEIYI